MSCHLEVTKFPAALQAANLYKETIPLFSTMQNHFVQGANAAHEYYQATQNVRGDH